MAKREQATGGTEDQEISGSADISIREVESGEITYCICGKTPLIYHNFGVKARQELLFPKPGRKNYADKLATPKHDPVREFVESTHRHLDRAAVDTRLYFPASGFKGTMLTAALDVPRTNQDRIGRLVWVQGECIDIYGVPSLFMRMVRPPTVGKRAAPDVRTRAILPRWACRVTISFQLDLIKEALVTTLLAMGGLSAGIGDNRAGKGTANYGQFSLVSEDDPLFVDLVTNEGREAQDRALKMAVPYDIETKELLDWYLEERQRRKTAVVPSRKSKLPPSSKPRLVVPTYKRG